jgi:hypothetical protein
VAPPPSSGTPPAASPGQSPAQSPTPPPPNLAQPLQSLYQEYETFQATGGTFAPPEASYLVLNGTSVGIQVHFSGTDFAAFMAALQSDGLQIIDSDPTFGIVEGMLPIAQLPTVAQIPQTLSITPMYKPMVR